MKTILTLLVALLIGFFLQAQPYTPTSTPARDTTRLDTAFILDIARAYIAQHLSEWGLTSRDIEGMTINDMYLDKTTGITRIYFLQHYRNIPVHNALMNINIDKDGSVFFAGNRFIRDIGEKVNATVPEIHVDEAIVSLAKHLGITDVQLQLTRESSEGYVYTDESVAREDISAKLCFQVQNERVLLAWNVLFAPKKNADKWSTRVDALDGSILQEVNWTLYCGAHSGTGNHTAPPVQHEPPMQSIPDMVQSSSGAQYNVWPAPTESPNHGPRKIVTDPFDPIASPFGWHDVNGLPGAEYTITRGNNAYVYQDRNNKGYSSNDEPNGGSSLHFNFPYNPQWEPEQYVDASAVNLFYWLNYMHDFSYRFGFDENAGNFQVNNYGNGGLGNDPIFGITQAAADAGIYNNPYYSHGDEGTRGVIFMEEYIRGTKCLRVDAPQEIAGIYPTAIPTGAWGDGALITTTPVTGEVVLVEDEVEEPLLSDGCEELTNASALFGKIAFFDRGGCDLAFKALNAQNAGAIGVILANHDDEAFTIIEPGVHGSEVHIPLVMITHSNAEKLRQYLTSGLTVSLVDPDLDQPTTFDIGLDNGFITHEYGHGIAWRMVGGPNAACFDNFEQMDEGWSDFFALITTVRPGDTGETPRGIGSYIVDEPTNGLGSRRFHYSTNMNISPLTYRDVAASHNRHDVGEMWANVLWDMYWAFVETYGWSADPFDPSSGNYMAIRLAFDGLKNLPCSPGFVDGRNALLAADMALYNGTHQYMLWEVFARRGLGFSADQGSPFDAGDQKAAFDVPPSCANSLLITKTVTDLIDAGDEIEVAITVRNFKNPALVTGVDVIDEIPEGTSFKPFSSNFPASVAGNEIRFELGDMQFGEEVTITYALTSDPGRWSRRAFLDDAEEVQAHWAQSSSCGDRFWINTANTPAHSGNFSWFAQEHPGHCIQILELDPDVYTFHVAGDFPVLRFYHRYHTQAAVDGGVIEIREAGTLSWKSVDDLMLRNGYPHLISYFTFSRLNLSAFSGSDNDSFKATYVDLRPWQGKNIQIRFRFGTNHIAPTGIGWVIDDIEFMDMITYNGVACVTSDQGDYACIEASQAGTIVESKAEIPSANEDLQQLSFKIYPNPATDKITILLSGASEKDILISIMTMDGMQIFSKSVTNTVDTNMVIDTGNLPAGMYIVRLSTATTQTVEKVVIQK